MYLDVLFTSGTSIFKSPTHMSTLACERPKPNGSFYKRPSTSLRLTTINLFFYGSFNAAWMKINCRRCENLEIDGGELTIRLKCLPHISKKMTPEKVIFLYYTRRQVILKLQIG